MLVHQVAGDKTDKHFYLQPALSYWSDALIIACYQTLHRESSPSKQLEEDNTCKQANHAIGSISVAVITLLLRASTTWVPKTGLIYYSINNRKRDKKKGGSQ